MQNAPNPKKASTSAHSPMLTTFSRVTDLDRASGRPEGSSLPKRRMNFAMLPQSDAVSTADSLLSFSAAATLTIAFFAAL